MNTFNMKQWLTANKVGPYAKVILSEEYEDNEKWIVKFKEKVKELEKDKFIQNQIFVEPSDSIISYYKNTTPEQAAKEAIRNLRHAAREGIEMTEDDDFSLEDNPLSKVEDLPKREYDEQQEFFEDKISLNDQTYVVDYVVHYDYSYDRRGKDFIVDDFYIQLQDIFLFEDGKWVETIDNDTRNSVREFLNSKPKKLEIFHKIELPDGDDMDDRDFDDPPDWYEDERDEYESQNEQLGVGYVMKTRPSDPLDR